MAPSRGSNSTLNSIDSYFQRGLAVRSLVFIMKQKIVVKVSMTCDECRSKALQTVSKIKGLISVAIDGPERDRVVVVGEDIDTVWLLDKLRKKVGHANIVTVEEIKPPAPPKPDKDKANCCPPALPHSPVFLHYPPPYSYQCYPIDDYDPSCTIM